MRAKTINEIQNFERGIEPKKSLRIGNTFVTDFLDTIKNDIQLDTQSEFYCGFVNVSEDSFNNDLDREAFIKFVETWPKFKQEMLNRSIDLEGDFPDLDETIFIKI